jgi:hypothetical protein
MVNLAYAAACVLCVWVALNKPELAALGYVLIALDRLWAALRGR